ncbi:hypothetical protein ACFWMS_29515 [Peribacillus butanolivorans]|uniref:hypothetical protein n=1 Tax=Peribacillus butanolivorans TaxID=421767 RepID=UPI003667A8A7
MPSIGCGRCHWCVTADPHFCPTVRNIGSESQQGAFAEYVKIAVDNCFPLSENLTVHEGALVDPLAVGFHVIRRGRVGPAGRVLILGSGHIGRAVLWWARRSGARRVVVASACSTAALFCLSWVWLAKWRLFFPPSMLRRSIESVWRLWLRGTGR